MYCKNCGARNEEGAKFCMACGSPMNIVGDSKNENPLENNLDTSYYNVNSVADQKTSHKKKKKKFGKILISILVIVLVVVVVGFVYMATHEPPVSDSLSENSTVNSYSNVTTTNRLPTREEYMEMCKTVEYKDIERNPSAYEGLDVRFTGQVIQVSEEDDGTTYRICVSKDEYGSYDDPVLVYYEREVGETRVLEDDIVTFYGECRGVYTYESVMGGQITVPAVYALIIEIED